MSLWAQSAVGGGGVILQPGTERQLWGYSQLATDCSGSGEIHFDPADGPTPGCGATVVSLDANSDLILHEMGSWIDGPKAGGKYSFGVALKGDSAGATFVPAVVWSGDNGGYTTSTVFAPQDVPAGTWQAFTMTATAPSSGVRQAHLAVRIYAGTSAHTVSIAALHQTLVVTSDVIDAGAVTSAALAPGAVTVSSLDLSPSATQTLDLKDPSDGVVVAHIWAEHSLTRKLWIRGADPPAGETAPAEINIDDDHGNGMHIGALAVNLASSDSIKLSAPRINFDNFAGSSYGATFGSAFPGSPSMGDHHFHTGFNQEAFWDGQWLSVAEIEAGWTLYPGANIGEISAAGTNEWLWCKTPKITSNGIKVTRFGLAAYINGTANSLNFWGVALRTFTGLAAMATHTLQTGSTWLEPSAITSFSNQPGASDLGLEITVTKNGSPGPLRVAPLVMYRHVLG